jgi:uncharacterized protein involved in copper resistance
VAEIKVFRAGVNVAKGKAVTQSSRYAAVSVPEANLVDERLDTIAHSSCGDAAWLSIDLGGTQNIERIEVYNRADCCSGRTIGARVELLNAYKDIVWTSDAFKGARGETQPEESHGGFGVYTITPPSTAVAGSN